MRLFIGIPLDAASRRRISKACDFLKECVQDTRWVKPENLHITMKFLGDTPGTMVPEIAEVLHMASVYLPFEMKLGGIGAFSSLGSARVIWVGAYDDSGTVHKIYKEIERGMSRLGYPGEKREYSPHVTVGRSRNKPVRIDNDVAARYKDLSILTVDEIILFQSDLRSSGAEYSIIERAVGQGLKTQK
ncbi:MAG: RNA 2',3'-cyclic phosphodiesterase [Actinobacteria bacterium]|nr:RNA 2',3'-cyclic phosphodiesterase [Actinomycetota bacterium]